MVSRDTGLCCDRLVGSESSRQMSTEGRRECRTQQCAARVEKQRGTWWVGRRSIRLQCTFRPDTMSPKQRKTSLPHWLNSPDKHRFIIWQCRGYDVITMHEMTPYLTQDLAFPTFMAIFIAWMFYYAALMHSLIFLSPWLAFAFFIDNLELKQQVRTQSYVFPL